MPSDATWTAPPLTARERAWSLAGVFTLPAALALFHAFLTTSSPAAQFEEGQAVEVWSAVLLAQGALGWFAAQGRHGWAEWQIPAMLALFAMRELDFDKRFTESGVFKLRGYTGDFPLGEKLLGLAVIAVLALCLWRLARRNLPGLLRDLRAPRAYALTLAVGCGLAALGKGLDGIGRKLAPLGVEIGETLSARAGVAEEGLELLAWWLLCLAAGLAIPRGGPRRGEARPMSAAPLERQAPRAG